MAGMLDGVLVLALEQAVALPYTTSRFADAGARVIKIERAEGDFARYYDTFAAGQCSFFVWLNRGKESLVLDIKKPDDAALMHRILARADIFAQNLAPGAAGRAGFATAALRERYPRLITCDISGYGDEGPYRDMKAYDLLVQAESGLAAITGGPEAPGRVGVSICDLGAGAHALAGLLQALYARERTGKASAVKVSLFDGLADWMTPPILAAEAGQPPGRIGFSHPMIAPYGAYQAEDGPIVIAVQNEREWARFCQAVLEKPGLARDPAFASNIDRVAHRAPLDAEIGEVFAKHTRAALAERLTAGQIAYGALNSVDDVARHPQLTRLPVDTEGGAVDLVAPGLHFEGEPLACRPVPSIGQHSTAIREEFAG